MSKILTISIAAYNVEGYIEQALSVFDDAKIINDIEVLVIDDGGTDRTLEIAKPYADKYPGSIKLIHKENGGWGSTVNYGLYNASGKYFKLLDGDDYFDSESLENFISLLKTVDSDLICTPYRTFDSDSGLILNTYAFNNDVDLNHEYTIEILHSLKNITMHMCTFKTEKLRRGKIHILEKCFYTDAEYVFKSIQCIDSVYLWNHVVYCYRLGRDGQSVSLDGIRKHMHDHTRMLDVLLESYASIESNVVKKELAKSSLHELITTQYKMYIWQLNSASFKNEIRRFDKRLKKDNPELYEVRLKRVNFLRKTHFNGISLISRFECRKMNR